MKVDSCIPKNEIDLISPLINYYGQEICSVLEIGCKKNVNGIYKTDFENLKINHVSIDPTGKHGSLSYDLETPVWESLGKFDMVTNIGTTEHFDNQKTVWENIHNCLNIGGVLVSITPHVGDFSGHGIWYPMTEFYEDFASKNGYQIEKLYVTGKEPRRLLNVRMHKKENLPFTFPDEKFLKKQM